MRRRDFFSKFGYHNLGHNSSNVQDILPGDIYFQPSSSMIYFGNIRTL